MPDEYILITAAFNEAKSISRTIASVLRQTRKPLKWVIVSDGSTDGTDAIVKRYGERTGWIVYARQEKRAADRHRLEKVTIAQARALNLGMSLLKDVDYRFLGNLDADTSLSPDFYEKILDNMAADPELGLAGGGVYTVDKKGRILPGGFIQPEFVGGPVQLFRRACIEDLGGYLEAGHADGVAVSRAKMLGWKVRCFPEVRAFQSGMPENTLREKVPVCFNMGRMDCLMGGLFTFQLVRCLNRMVHRPFFFAGAAMMLGYFHQMAFGEKTRLPKEVVDFMQVEQIEKLKRRVPLSGWIGRIGALEAVRFWKNPKAAPLRGERVK